MKGELDSRDEFKTRALQIAVFSILFVLAFADLYYDGYIDQFLQDIPRQCHSLLNIESFERLASACTILLAFLAYNLLLFRMFSSSWRSYLVIILTIWIVYNNQLWDLSEIFDSSRELLLASNLVPLIIYLTSTSQSTLSMASRYGLNSWYVCRSCCHFLVN